MKDFHCSSHINKKDHPSRSFTPSFCICLMFGAYVKLEVTGWVTSLSRFKRSLPWIIASFVGNLLRIIKAPTPRHFSSQQKMTHNNLIGSEFNRVSRITSLDHLTANKPTFLWLWVLTTFLSLFIVSLRSIPLSCYFEKIRYFPWAPLFCYEVMQQNM